MAIVDRKLARAQVIQEIRNYFTKQHFIETDTPSLVLSPGMEPHIRPLKVEGNLAFLPTSPEFAMKQLLAQGYHRIFQICRAYRWEPKSHTHNPEFNILEWYRGNSGYEAIMDDVEELFSHICLTLYGSDSFHTDAYDTQDLSRPWLRLSIEECFRRFAQCDLVAMMPQQGATLLEKEKFNDEFFRIFLNTIEPSLAALKRPVIVHGYPESQAALSNLFEDHRGIKWAKRFEVYAGGLELGNAFDELTDAVEQRRRFINDMKIRKDIYGDTYPMSPLDEPFLNALATMPPSGGIAMGVDRLVMYFTGATRIEEVLWLPSHWG